jgi:hypothetical protein
VLRWTTTVGFNSNNYRNSGTTEFLYTTSQVLAEADPPAAIANTMASINAPDLDGAYLWSWRRIPSTRTTVAGNRVEISVEQLKSPDRSRGM